jgi:hypothetical protein
VLTAGRDRRIVRDRIIRSEFKVARTEAKQVCDRERERGELKSRCVVVAQNRLLALKSSQLSISTTTTKKKEKAYA